MSQQEPISTEQLNQLAAKMADRMYALNSADIGTIEVVQQILGGVSRSTAYKFLADNRITQIDAIQGIWPLGKIRECARAAGNKAGRTKRPRKLSAATA